MSLSDELQQLLKANPDVALILEAFGEIERVHGSALEAMGLRKQYVSDSKSSSEVAISFRDVQSTVGPLTHA